MEGVDAIIWADAHENTVKKVVNQFGKKMTFNNGGYRIGVLVEKEDEKKEFVFYNRLCPDQFAGECYSILKAVEVAKEMGLKKVLIRNDRIDSFDASVKCGYIGAKYLYVARKISEEGKICVEFKRCSRIGNKADRLSRRGLE
jgi:hypothetical protein